MHAAAGGLSATERASPSAVASTSDAGTTDTFAPRRLACPMLGPARAGLNAAGDIRSANSKGGAILTMRKEGLVAPTLPSALLAVTTQASV